MEEIGRRRPRHRVNRRARRTLPLADLTLSIGQDWVDDSLRGNAKLPYWFVVALACALLTACSDAVSKRVMIVNDEWITGTVILATSALILTPVFLSQDLKPISRDLLLVLVIALPLEVLGYYLFLSSIRTAPLSLTVPLLAFTPVLTILTSAILLGERVSMTGALGISLVTVGAYILNGNLAKQDPVAPLRAIVSNPGSRRMLMVAVVWSVTSSLGKMGVLIYGAIPFGFLLLCGIVVAFAVASVLRLKSRQSSINLPKGMPVLFLIGGVFMAGAEISHFVSLSMAPVSYMISVKRLSLVFGVALGWLFFREHNIKYRLVGCAVMVLGVFLLYE